MLEIYLEGTNRLDSLGRRLHVLTFRKLTELTDLMYNKVIENLSGKILNKQSGALAESIKIQTEDHGEIMTGVVYVSPETEKARVLEYGGKGYYPILPVKGEALKWISKGGETVYAKSVFHPPSREFAYLRTAAEEMAPIIPEQYKEAIQAMLDRGAFE